MPREDNVPCPYSQTQLGTIKIRNNSAGHHHNMDPYGDVAMPAFRCVIHFRVAGVITRLG